MLRITPTIAGAALLLLGALAAAAGPDGLLRMLRATLLPLGRPFAEGPDLPGRLTGAGIIVVYTLPGLLLVGAGTLSGRRRPGRQRRHASTRLRKSIVKEKAEKRSGIRYPQIVDLITRAPDGTMRLIIAEVDPIRGDRILALQDKLSHYLAFARDGSLAEKYPDAAGAPVRIRVDLYAEPDALVLEFLRRFRILALRDAVDVELSVFQKEVPL